MRSEAKQPEHAEAKYKAETEQRDPSLRWG
jgi:hypothetical protein